MNAEKSLRIITFSIRSVCKLFGETLLLPKTILDFFCFRMVLLILLQGINWCPVGAIWTGPALSSQQFEYSRAGVDHKEIWTASKNGVLKEPIGLGLRFYDAWSWWHCTDQDPFYYILRLVSSHVHLLQEMLFLWLSDLNCFVCSRLFLQCFWLWSSALTILKLEMWWRSLI